jgi:hypothetical protein
MIQDEMFICDLGVRMSNGVAEAALPTLSATAWISGILPLATREVKFQLLLKVRAAPVTEVFQFRESDGVEFIHNGQEISGQVVLANGDPLLVQLQTDCSVMYWVPLSDVMVVRRGGAIHVLNREGKEDGGS